MSIGVQLYEKVFEGFSLFFEKNKMAAKPRDQSISWIQT